MAAKDGVTIRGYQPGDETKINLLHNREYGTDRNIEQWQWEFGNNPYGGSVVVVAESGGSIVGTQTLLPAYLSWHGGDILTAKIEDSLVGSELRGQGVMRKMMESCFAIAAQRKMVLLWGITKNPTPFTRYGWRYPRKLNNAILILSPNQVYQLKKHKIPPEVRSSVPIRAAQLLLLRVFAVGGFLWSKTKASKMKPGHGFRVDSMTRTDKKIDLFWKSFSQNEGRNICTIARTSTYLDWRVFRNPNMTSQLLAALDDNEIKGYVIISRSKRENVGYITDFCVADDRFEEVAESLGCVAIESLRSQGVAYIDSWYLNSQNKLARRYARWLKRFGFVSIPGSDVGLRPLPSDGGWTAEIADLNNWFITFLFSEGT